MPDADARRGGSEQPLSYPLGVPKSIMAGNNGAVAAVGLCFALFCDIRFIAADAKVTTAFSRRGLVAEYGSAWISRRTQRADVGPRDERLKSTLSDRLYSKRKKAFPGVAEDEPDFLFCLVVKRPSERCPRRL